MFSITVFPTPANVKETDEYFLNKETWGRKQKDRPPGPPCHTHSPVCFHYAVISADRKLKPVEEHFLRIQAVRVLPDLPE